MPSDFENVVSDLLAKWQVAIPGINVTEMSIPADEIPGDKLPHVQVVVSEEVVETQPAQQGFQRMSLTFQLTMDGKVTLFELWAHLDAFRARVWADRRLGAYVDFSEVSDRQQNAKLADRWIANVVVVTEKGI